MKIKTCKFCRQAIDNCLCKKCKLCGDMDAGRFALFLTDLRPKGACLCTKATPIRVKSKQPLPPKGD